MKGPLKLTYALPKVHRSRLGVGSVALITAVCMLVGLIRFLGRNTTNYTVSNEAKIDMDNIRLALEMYYRDIGSYPSEAVGLKALVNDLAKSSEWKGPYIKHLPRDPWGTNYQYRCSPENAKTEFSITSAGPDRRFGTADDIICKSSDPSRY